MIGPADLAAIDRDYFNILSAGGYDITLQHEASFVPFCLVIHPEKLMELERRTQYMKDILIRRYILICRSKIIATNESKPLR